MKVLSLAILFAAPLSGAQADTITDWNFDSMAIAANNSPAPSTGTGVATALGMTNSYNGTTSVNSDDIIATAGASTGSASNAWRVRGASPGNGWSSQAPIGSQGAEFDTSTVGYKNISVSFDLYFTTQAPAKFELEYTTDGTNWINASTLSYAADSAYIMTNTSSANTVTGTYFDQTGGQNWYNGISADLSGVILANNDANFGIRIVNAATGADDVAYNGTAYNNSSGNVRFDNVVISGTAVSAVPVPGAVWLFGSALAGFVGFKRRKSA
ncbi:MAG: PEP-CTERM sorting domain-containing protein [Methylococcales bacterium]|nr:PEP-CTERM sorting domain-containing protein [Methylococcales bacterium]